MKKQYRKNDVIFDIPSTEELAAIAAACKTKYSVNALNLTKLTGKLLYTVGLGTHSLDNEGCRARMTCGDGSVVCTHCYTTDAFQLMKLRGVYPRLHHNAEMLRAGLSDETVANTAAKIRLEWEMLRLEALEAGVDHIEKNVRINPLGEARDVHDCLEEIKIMRACPEFTFAVWSHVGALWVKAFDMVGKPENCVFGISSLRINQIDAIPAAWAKYVDFTFTVTDSDEYIKQRGAGCTMCTHAGCNSGCHSACYKHHDGAPVNVLECLKAQAKKIDY